MSSRAGFPPHFLYGGEGTDTGLLTVVGVGKGMLHVRHLAPKILMADNYCESQLANRFG